MTQRILILGATSAIAEATALQLATRPAEFFLVARDSARLNAVAGNLHLRRNVNVHTCVADLSDIGSHTRVCDQAWQTLGQIDTVFIAYGMLPNQVTCEVDSAQTASALMINAVSVMALLQQLAARLDTQGFGVTAVLTSVAGMRGRRSNYVYGSAKGAVSIFLAGLRHRFAGKPVHWVDIRPGFVSSPMTAHLAQGILFASPAGIAPAIVKAIDRRATICYVPWFWRWIMLIICLIPERIFVRTSI